MSFTLYCKVNIKSWNRKPLMKEIITDSLRYWEPRRVAFNAALALVVAGAFLYHRAPLDAWTRETVVGLALAGVMANVLYSSAYAVDLLVQSSEYRQSWLRCRWLLWVAGTVLAAAMFLLHE